MKHQEYFPLGGLDVQLEVWDEQLSLQSRLCILQQVCEAMLFLRLQGGAIGAGYRWSSMMLHC